LRQAAGLDVAGLSVWGRCHLELATTLKDLAACEDQASYDDEAQLHYRSALNESEAIGNHRMAAIAENNLGFLLLNLGLLEESEKRLLRARLFFEALSDNVRRAQVNETLTRLYITTGEYSVAQRTIDDALQTLELTDGEAVLSEALTTSGIVACRLQRFVDAQKRFESACKVAERCGDREGARRALVSMFEEMKERLHMDELRQMLEKLSRLNAVTEPSPLVGRVGETIAAIQSMLAQHN
jgi:tetratricopeptide (TPR) repeat protein